MYGYIAITVFAGFLIALSRPGLLKNEMWRATTTPLASIIGSGFLVSVPILRNVVGSWAIIAMTVLLVIAYLVGAAIRENIAHVEPLLENGNAGAPIVSFERLSQLVLTFAYFISVAYYLNLFAHFMLKTTGFDQELYVNLVVTILLITVGSVGLLRGFHAVEGLEIYAVSVKLAVIGGLLATLLIFDVAGLLGWVPAFGGDLIQVDAHFAYTDLPVILGLLIIVQGFETSRFLGNSYSRELRIRTMKLSQAIAALIYILFFALVLPIMGAGSDSTDVAAVTDMMKPVALILPFFVILGALASQSSAALADAMGAAGLVHELAGKRIRINHIYPLIALVAAIVTWEADIYGLITLASRCFALYYALQCMIACMSAIRRKSTAATLGFGVLTVVCMAIVIFGVPAEGG